MIGEENAITPDILSLFTRTAKAVRQSADAAMRRHGLRLGQDRVLAALWEKDGRTPGNLAKQLNVTTPTIVKMADRMTASGLLTRRRDDPDNRLVRLYLTDKGRDLQGPVTAELDRLRHRLTDNLTNRENRYFTAALDKIVRGLQAPDGPHDYTSED